VGIRIFIIAARVAAYSIADRKWKTQKDVPQEEVLEKAREKNVLLGKQDFKNIWDNVTAEPDVYLHFGDISRLGPKPTFVTNWRGIYGWKVYGKSAAELKQAASKAFRERKLMHFFRVKDMDKVLDVSKYNDDDLKRDLEKVKKEYPDYADRLDELFKTTKDKGFDKLDIILSDVETELPKIGGAEVSGRTFSTRFLRKIGYVGISGYLDDVITIFATKDIEQVAEVNNPFYESKSKTP
jgi:hypothetical protein